MRFGVDIDGVIASFTTAFTREVNNIWLGKLPINYMPTNWDWSPELTKADIDKVWERIKGSYHWWLSVPPDFENVRALAIHRIRHPSDEIFYVTARVPTKGMPVMHQTQTWLEQCGIGGLGTAVIVDNTGDKSSIFNSLECDANIDDKLEAVIDHDRETNGACLLDRPYNRVGRPTGLRVVTSLDEFFRRAATMGRRSDETPK